MANPPNVNFLINNPRQISRDRSLHYSLVRFCHYEKYYFQFNMWNFFLDKLSVMNF
jgi:hypothetical protein